VPSLLSSYIIACFFSGPPPCYRATDQGGLGFIPQTEFNLLCDPWNQNVFLYSPYLF
jgi:hypothetical protein